MNNNFKVHPFHLVSLSPWATLVCLTSFYLTVSLTVLGITTNSCVGTMHILYYSPNMFCTYFIAILVDVVYLNNIHLIIYNCDIFVYDFCLFVKKNFHKFIRHICKLLTISIIIKTILTILRLTFEKLGIENYNFSVLIVCFLLLVVLFSFLKAEKKMKYTAKLIFNLTIIISF